MTDDELAEALVGRGLSPKTVAVYLAMVRRARSGLSERGRTLEDVGAAELAAWADAELGPRRPMRALARSALKAYWSASGRPDGPSGAVRVPRRSRMRCRALSEADAGALAAVAARRAQEGTRKGLAVLLGLYGGLRASEIAGVRWSHISDGWLTVVGKGSERRVPLHPAVSEALAGARLDPPGPGARGGGPLFAGSRRRDHLHPTTVWTWVRELAAEAGLPPFGSHVLRHTALATALEATGDLRAVQELAGHARPETTAGYTRVRADRLRAAASAIDYGAPA